ncbi:heme transporter FLVCR2-like [Watersipora subatra]|uniref:heme transporter FLVCR2-like n=1 Tax=Watersipora subatra TaxID=2589382 RepID=UPI00355C0AF4
MDDEESSLEEKLSSAAGLDNPQAPASIRVYRRRWILLVLFTLYSMTSAYQWIHLNIIFDVIKTYYNESLPGADDQQKATVDWLSMVYMLAYIPLILPQSWLLDQKGLRLTAILGSFLNCLGAWLKCAAVSPNRFLLLLVAQTICAIAQVFILGTPPRLAAVWFGPDEVSTATSLGVFGNQLGAAVGFVLSPYIVELHEDLSLTGKSLSYLFYGGAGYTTLLFILVVLVFRSYPSLPPSRAQYKIVTNSSQVNYLSSLRQLSKNFPFCLLVLTYGLNAGVYYSVGTLLNPIILGFFPVEQYPNIHTHCGWIGLTLVIGGLVGSVLAGVWLDKSKHFKLTTVGIYVLSLSGCILFTATLYLKQMWVVYLAAGMMGFFMTGYLPVGFEFAAELTYPESEGTSSGLLNASAQLFGIVLILSMGSLMRGNGEEKLNIRNSLLLANGVLLLGTALTVGIKNNLFRQRAERQHIYETNNAENYGEEMKPIGEEQKFTQDSANGR